MIKRFLIAISFLGVSLFSLSTPVGAVSPTSQMAVCGSGLGNIFGIQPWYACLQAKNGSVSIKAINDVFYILFPLIEALVKIAAYVAIFMIFFLIIKIITARGNAGQIATAGNGIRDAIIGLIIAISAVAIVNFIASRFI